MPRYQSRQQNRTRNPTLGTLLQQPNSSGDRGNHEGCNLQMLYLMGKNMSASRMVTFVHIGFHLAQFL